MKKECVLKIKNYIYVLKESNEFTIAFDKNTWLRENFKNYQFLITHDNISQIKTFLSYATTDY